MSEYAEIYNAIDDGVTKPDDIARMRAWLLDAAQASADRDRFRAALEQVRDYDAAKAAGYLDEWAEADAFGKVQAIAAEALRK